jgi:hypothetical protein
VPRLSNAIKRENVASLSSHARIQRSSHISSMFETQPGMYTRSTGPSPRMQYATWTSPLFAYRVSGTSMAQSCARPGVWQCRPSAAQNPNHREESDLHDPCPIAPWCLW